MKILVPLLVFLLSTQVFCQQKLFGKYCSESFGDSDVVCMEFKENYQFDYVITGPMGIKARGSGEFELHNQRLKLVFANKKQRIESSVTKTDSESKYPRDIKLTFEIKDDLGNPLAASVHRIDDAIDYLTEDSNTVWVKKDTPIAYYKVQFIGYEPIEFPLAHHFDQEIKVTLVPIQPKLISNEVMVFMLRNITDEGFSTGNNLWDHYRKVTVD